MKWLAVILISLQAAVILGQTAPCDEVFTENSKLGSTHYLKTSFVKSIVRSNYTYSLSFQNSEAGIFLVVQTLNGGVLNMNDEIIFIDHSQVRKRYRFVRSGEVVTVNNTPVHENRLQLDLEAVKWFASQRMITFYVVNHVTNRMRKLSPLTAKQDELHLYANCFLDNLDPLMVNQNIVASDPISNELTTTGVGDTPKGTVADSETDQLAYDLEQLKEQLRKEIKAEQNKASLIKSQLMQEVQLAQESAERLKAQYAQEVLDARRRSEVEIQHVEEETQQMVIATRDRAANAVSRYESDVDSARARAIEEIRTAQLRAAEEIARIRENTSTEIARMNVALDEARQAYSDELASARENAQAELDRIRETTTTKIADANATALKSEQMTAEEVVAARKNASEEIRQISEGLALQIGQIKENAALEEERLAVEMAELRRGYAESVALLTQSQEAEMQQLREAFTRQKTNEIEKLAEVRREVSENIASLHKQQRDEQKALENAIEVLRMAHADSIKKAYQLRDDQLDRIAADLARQRSRADHMIDSIRTEAMDQITALREAQSAESKRIEAEIAILYKNAEEERQELALQLRYEQLKVDSIKSVTREQANNDVARIRASSRKVIEESEELTRDVLAAQQKALDEARVRYAEEVALARISAEKKIRQIEEDLSARIDELNNMFNEQLASNIQNVAEFKESKQREILEAGIEAEKTLAQIAKEVALAQEDAQISVAKARQESATALANLMASETRIRQEAILKTRVLLDSLNNTVLVRRNQTADEIAALKHNALLKVDSIQQETAKDVLAARERAAQARMESGEAIRLAKERATEEIAAIQRATIMVLAEDKSNRDSTRAAINADVAVIIQNGRIRIDSIRNTTDREILETIRASNEKKYQYINEAEEVRIAAHEEIAGVRLKLANDVYEAQKEAAAQITLVKEKTAEQIRNLNQDVRKETEKLNALKEEIKRLEIELGEAQKKSGGNNN